MDTRQHQSVERQIGRTDAPDHSSREGSAGTLAGWLRLASDKVIVRRALAYAVVVGAVLITINHGDAILAGRIDGTRIAKMILTVAVPYVVSTLSSIGAIRGMRR